MIEAIKNTSLLTKILYFLALILFIIWVIPTIFSYYTNVNSYEKSLNELKETSSKYELSTKAETFSEDSFKQYAQPLFKTVNITTHGEKLYTIDIAMKKEELKNFYTFIETLALRYHIKITDDIELKADDAIIHSKVTIKSI